MTHPNGTLADVVSLLSLDRVDGTTLVGRAVDPGWGQLYGGHVFAQALAAARMTVPADRSVHVHQGTYLLAGDVEAPITYAVEVSRDGRSFSSRRVAAYQRGQMIFHASTSFQTPDAGYAHQDAMPLVPPPEEIATEASMMDRLTAGLPGLLRDRIVPSYGFELRPTPAPDHPIHPAPRSAERDVWIRGIGPVGDDPELHAQLLAYASDYFFFPTSLMPHGVTWLSPKMHVATLNHTVWFHEPPRMDAWVLHAMRSPWAAHARGLAQGAFYDQAGRLLATSTQEGLMRGRATPS